jgi:hypothetical protein
VFKYTFEELQRLYIEDKIKLSTKFLGDEHEGF